MTGSPRARWSRLAQDSRRRRVAPENLPFPTSAQLDLLKAALLPAEQAAPAWRRWKGRGLALQTVADEPSMRVFPLLWANREAAAVETEDLALLRGIYRHTLARNVSTLADAVNTSQLLADAGIPVLFFKGAAVIAHAGDRMALRRIDDVDLLIPEADAERAHALLVEAGYQMTRRRWPVGVAHAWPYRAPTMTSIDLHWWAFKVAGDDSAMFETAQESTLLRRPVVVASPTECLIDAVANAFQVWGSPMRWIADAMVLFDKAPIDWEYVLARAPRPGVTLGLLAGLDFLAREFGAPVPDDVLAQLRRRPVTLRERAAHWVALHRPPVGAPLMERIERHRALRLHTSIDAPRDLLWYLAQQSDSRRRDVLRRAPRVALRSTAILVLSRSRQRRSAIEQSGRRV